MNDYQDGQENAPLLELRGVSQRYSQGTIDLDVLIDANLTVLAGELKALVGPSGSGKSTLIDILLGLIKPKQGQLIVNDIVINDNNCSWINDLNQRSNIKTLNLIWIYCQVSCYKFISGQSLSLYLSSSLFVIGLNNIHPITITKASSINVCMI